ncbi:hypothetical protein [Haloferula sp. A504]|uniref:hypothetical protein n=1 Tax=Haloferula sp. A504 TaxID=3373601 RepID=UPI0031BF9C75|nr:hypothetical protein [Verrucomicrobiaceae bacterium E54]
MKKILLAVFAAALLAWPATLLFHPGPCREMIVYSCELNQVSPSKFDWGSLENRSAKCAEIPHSGISGELMITFSGLKKEFVELEIRNGKGTGGGWMIHRDRLDLNHCCPIPSEFDPAGQSGYLFEGKAASERSGATFYFIPDSDQNDRGRILVHHY